MQPKIAISVNKFARAGGMESYMLDLVRGFHESGQKVSVYAGDFDTTLSAYQQINPKQVPTKRIPKKLRRLLFDWAYQRLSHENEQLISHNLVEKSAIMICGGTHIGYLKAMGQSSTLMDKWTIEKERRVYQTAKYVMAHSKLMQAELVQYYDVDEQKIHVIYPPADTNRFKLVEGENREAIRKQFGFDESETVFLFPSTGHKRKGLDLLADFFENTTLPVKLAVAGSPLPRPMKNVLELGFCTDMPMLYRAVDYTIMASLYEPFGLVGVESILSGTPVVLSSNMACTEVINANAGLFFSRDDGKTLSHAIERAVTLKNEGKSKLTEPFSALAFDPHLNTHMQEVQRLLQQLPL